MESDIPAGAKTTLFSYHGDTGELFKIYLVNFLLTIITLGIYRFWGKTRIRRYLWSHIEILGDRLEYIGTPKELLIGFLIVLLFVLVPLFAIPELLLFLAEDENLAAQSAVGTVQILVVYFLIPVAIYRARRYKLSRTQWRGIRAGQTGSAFKYSVMTFLFLIVEVLTLSLTMPIFRKKLAHYRLNNTWFGNSKLTFEADAGPLYGPFFGMIGLYAIVFIIFMVAMLILGGVGAVLMGGLGADGPFDRAKLDEWSTAAAVPTITIFILFVLLIQLPRLWYIAAEMKYFASKTKLNGLSFHLELSRWRYMWFAGSNRLIAFFSLGLALPYVYNRYLRYFSERLSYAGDIDALLVDQSVRQDPTRGEGLADAFDVGGI